MGPFSSSREREVDTIMDMSEREPSEKVVSMLETLEWHGYYKIAQLIDQGEYDSAGKVVEVLEKVGII